MPLSDWSLVFTVGVLLGAALVAGQLAGLLRLPRVTAYLLTGVVLGPQILHAISEEDLVHLHPFGKLAMALVLLIIGCHFPLVYFRRILRRVLQISAGELGLTFLLVSIGLTLVTHSWQAATLLGALAIASAPATTILVLKENKSEGPITEYATALVVLNNLAAVVIFEVLFLAIRTFDGHVSSPFSLELARLTSNLGGSVILGIGMGLVVSYACGLLTPGAWLVLLISASTLLLGLCDGLNIPYLLAFLAMGLTVANASDRAKEMVAELDRITGLLCVVFFVIHGADLNFGMLFEAGDVGLVYATGAYIALRTLGKYFGVYFTGKGEHDGPVVRRWLGTTIMSQAGAAIALAAIAADDENGLGLLGKNIQTVVLSAVIVFEIVGPILIQISVRRAGEVPLSHAIHHTTTTPFEELRAMSSRLLRAFGFDPWKGRSPDQLTVGQLMRRSVKGIPASATFPEVVDFIEQNHDNTYPVVDNEGKLVGVIRYPDLRDALFDPELQSLVRAEDLAQPSRRLIYADEPVVGAWQHLRHAHDDCVPVVTREEPHKLMGLIRRRDLIGLFAKRGDAVSEDYSDKA